MAQKRRRTAKTKSPPPLAPLSRDPLVEALERRMQHLERQMERLSVRQVNVDLQLATITNDYAAYFHDIGLDPPFPMLLLEPTPPLPRARVQAQPRVFRNLDVRMDDLEERIRNLDVRMGDLEVRGQALEADIAKMERFLARVSQYLASYFENVGFTPPFPLDLYG